MQKYREFVNVSYDSMADALYIKFNNNDIFDSQEEKQWIIVDYDKFGNIVWVEILSPKKNKDIVNWLLYWQYDLNKWKSILQIMHYKE